MPTAETSGHGLIPGDSGDSKPGAGRGPDSSGLTERCTIRSRRAQRSQETKLIGWSM